jgi:siroheme synthase-like protein
VVGGGQVAQRKVKTLLESHANVEVISPEINPELNRLKETGKIRVIKHSFQPSDLKGASLVVAATDDKEINQAVAREARNLSILVNAVDDASSSDFIVPSCIKRGELTIAISTSGLSPALARKLRIRLERELADEYASLVFLVNEVRNELIHQGILVDSDKWQEALDLDTLIELIKQGEIEKAKTNLLNSLKPNH